VALVGTATAVNYMYEKANVKGVGYKNVETIIQTQVGLDSETAPISGGKCIYFP
jgi:hypothetical protein